MKGHVAAGKAIHSTADGASKHSSADRNAAALAPPAYGIPFVDSGLPDQLKAGIEALDHVCACSGGCTRCQKNYPLLDQASIPQPAAEARADKAAQALVRGDPLPVRTAVRPPHPAGLAQRKEEGFPLSGGERSWLEGGFGVPLGDVRMHTGPSAVQTAQSLGARAVSFGRDVLFADGAHRPREAQGRALIAHEIAHLVYGDGLALKPAGDPPIELEVPEGPAADFQLPDTYPWENETLRGTVYPFREEMLSFFLQTYRVLELTKDPSQALAPLVDEIRAERASVLARQTAVNDRLKDMEKRKVSKESTEWKQAEQEWKLLRDKLTFLPDPDKKKGKKLSQSERIDWTAYKDARLGDSGTALTHDERLHKVIAMFDADADFSVYPAWLRYMVLHFSGMRYASAHRSFGGSGDLLALLKGEETLTAPEAKLDAVAATRAADLANPERRLKKPAGAAKVATEALDKFRAAPFGKGSDAKAKAFSELLVSEGERAHYRSEHPKPEPGPPSPSADSDLEAAEAKLAEFDKRIDELTAVIDAKDLQKARVGLTSRLAARRQALAEYEIERTRRDFAALDEEGRLGMLFAMNRAGTFPDWVWREIVRKTGLKLIADDTSWDLAGEAEAKEHAAKKKSSDPKERRWVRLLERAWGESGAWRSEHRDTLLLDYIPIRAVCNEVSEMLQHARGISGIAGGLSQKMQWYAEGKGGAGTKLIRPAAEADLAPGATLFFLKWDTVPPGDKINRVSHDVATQLLITPNGTHIVNGLKETEKRTKTVKGQGKTKPVEEEWTYRVDPTDKGIRREHLHSLPTGTAGPVQLETQWLVVYHEATVVRPWVGGHLITFETGPIGVRTGRTITKGDNQVLNQWNVLLGYTPDVPTPVSVFKYLKEH